MTKKASSPSLEKLGLHSSLDCVLHLPIRYEDETKLSTIGQAVGTFGGLTFQVQGCCDQARGFVSSQKAIIGCHQG